MEEEKIGRRLTAWLNQWPELPPELAEGGILYGRLPEGAPGMALLPEGELRTVFRDILGNREEERSFRTLYRVLPGGGAEERLKADEALLAMAAWAEKALPELGPEVLELRLTEAPALWEKGGGGEEERGLLFSLRYTVKAS